MIPAGSRVCESGWMRKGIKVRLGPDDRERLEAVIGSGNSPQKHVWRARIVLLSAAGVGTMAIQRQTGKGKPTIWRWIAIVPTPAALSSTIRARHTCFCGLFPDPITASSRSRSSGPSRTLMPFLIQPDSHTREPAGIIRQRLSTSLPLAHRFLAACYAHMGRLDEARSIVERLRAITPVVMPDASYLRNPEHRELYLSGLRLAAGEAE